MLKLRHFYQFSMQNYVLASKISGSSSDSFYELYQAKYANTALGRLK